MITANLARTVFKYHTKNTTNFKIYGVVYRNLTSQAKGNFRRSFRSTLAESNTIAQTESPFRIGRAFLAGSSLIGLGSLAYYGLGFSNQSGFLDQSVAWPQYIRDRIHTTYGYFGASIGVSVAAALAAARSPVLMNFLSKNSLFSVFATFAAVIASGMVVRSIPYEEGKFGSKQLAWLAHAGLIGGMVAPMTFVGGPLLMRAAMYTAGIIGGLSIVAATAPSDKFLNMGGPLAIGLGVVFAASIGGMFLPPTTRLGLSLYSLSIYGGLVLFSMFLLYDTQKIVHRAQTSPYYDPVNESISIYMDTLNIFIRMVAILSGNRRK